MLYVSASTFDTYYARIMYDEVYLYKAPIEVEDYSNIYFSLPRTYFVELLESSNNQFYKVNYLSFTGYVKKDVVQTIVGKPITPYLENQNFRVYSEQSRDMRSEPSTLSGSSSQIVYIPLYSRNLTYYGTIRGEQLVDGRTNIWYYCKYLDGTSSTMGFLYSLFCDKLTNIPTNTEILEIRTEPIFVEKENTGAISTINFSSPTQILIVVAVCMPCLLIIYLLFKPTKITNKENSKENVKKIKRLRKSDYYEIDD